QPEVARSSLVLLLADHALQQWDGTCIIPARAVKRAKIEIGFCMRWLNTQNRFKHLDGLLDSFGTRKQHTEIRTRGDVLGIELQRCVIRLLSFCLTTSLV